MANKKLTLKEEKFCQLLIETGSQIQAYTIVYGKEGTKIETNRRKACALCKTEHIADRIAELRKELEESHIITKIEMLKHLKDILNATKNTTKEKAIAIKAIETYNKMCGFNEPDRLSVDTTWKIDFGDKEDK